MKKIAFLLIILTAGLYLIINTKKVSSQTTAAAVIDVQSYGATGNGITDDTNAIQRAVNAAAGRSALHFPRPAAFYKVTSSIKLASDLTITGEQSIILMPSVPEESNTKSIFRNDGPVSNVDISGLFLKSANSRPGDGYMQGALTSNVQGLYLQNATNIRIHDMDFTDFVNGIKFSTSASTGIFINRVNIYRSSTPIYMSHVDGVHMADVLLDGTGFNDSHLHCIYFETQVRNVVMDRVTFQNEPSGGGIHLYQEGGVGASNIRLSNVTARNLSTVFIVWSGAENVVIDGFNAENVTKVFSFSKSSNILMKNGTMQINNIVGRFDAQVTNVQISDLQVNGSQQWGANYLFDLSRGTNVTIDNINTFDLRGGVRLLL